MIPLELLEPQGRAILTPEFLKGEAALSFSGFHAPLEREPTPSAPDVPRQVDIEPLTSIVRRAMTSYSPAESDRWLAPRVHATLRLYRREAADQRVWDYLALAALPDYARWRFGGTDGTPPEFRFIGPDYRHALARLWWGAELTRNGVDYSPTVLAFQMQDIPHTWMRNDAFHHRPAVLAAIRLLSTINNGGLATSDQQNALGQALNLALTTTVLDAVAPNPTPDLAAIEDWLAESVNETLMYEQMPQGPSEQSVPEEAIAKVETLLRRLMPQASGRKVRVSA